MRHATDYHDESHETKEETHVREQPGPHNQFLYFLETLWLFTLSDVKTFVIPETAFGILSALSGPIVTTNSTPQLCRLLARVPHTLLWTWLNTFIFVLANQRLPHSVTEDKLNKPWRPLPAGRITTTQTRRLLLFTIPTTILLTLFLGGLEEAVLLIALTWMYNDLGGADEDFVIRNIINGFAFAAYSSGATRVVGGYTDAHFSLNTAGFQWLALVGAIVFSTLQVQDLKDQEGDRARERSTAPLVLGDGLARWTIAIPVIFWSVACPAFWDLGYWGFVLPVSVGCMVTARVLLMRSRRADVATWKAWSAWMIVLYLLPLFKDHEALDIARIKQNGFGDVLNRR